MALLLEDLYSGKLQSHNVMIKDTAEAPGRHLLIALLHSILQRYDHILLITFERPAHFYVNALPSSLRKRVQTLVNIPKAQTVGERLHVGCLIEAVLSCIQGSEQRLAVVIDSVSTMAWTYSATAVPQLIKSLQDFKDKGNKVKQVISLVHTDVHEDTLRLITGGQVDVVIELQPSRSPQHQHTCLVQQRDSPQQASMENFSLSEDFLHVRNIAAQSKTAHQLPSTADAQTDPTANLTFNLTLKPEEKEARDQIVLPYTEVSRSEEESGAIHYIPDEADDFDDEDPDDDLDF